MEVRKRIVGTSQKEEYEEEDSESESEEEQEEEIKDNIKKLNPSKNAVAKLASNLWSLVVFTVKALLLFLLFVFIYTIFISVGDTLDKQMLEGVDKNTLDGSVEGEDISL